MRNDNQVISGGLRPLGIDGHPPNKNSYYHLKQLIFSPHTTPQHLRSSSEEDDTPQSIVYTPGGAVLAAKRLNSNSSMFDILPQLLVNSLITGSIYALASAGVVLTFSLLRILNFAHGHIMMVGAYVFLFFHAQLEYSIFSALLLSIPCLIALSLVTLRVFILPFSAANSLLPLITTIALGTMLESIISMWFGVNVRSYPTAEGLESIQLGSIFITPLQIFIILSSVVILGALAFVVHQTSLGRRVRAIAENAPAAEGLGISRQAVVVGIFTLSILLAAYAGILVGYETNIQPTMGGTYSIKAFAAMVLGGLGNVWGTIAGALILGLVENLSIGLDFGGYSLPAGYKDAFAFVIILLALLFRPQGLFGGSVRVS